LVTGSIIADKLLNIIVYPFLVVLLLDQLLGLALAWVGYSNSIICSCDQGYTD
jgi:hypothetical protein